MKDVNRLDDEIEAGKLFKIGNMYTAKDSDEGHFVKGNKYKCTAFRHNRFARSSGFYFFRTDSGIQLGFEDELLLKFFNPEEK